MGGIWEAGSPSVRQGGGDDDQPPLLSPIPMLTSFSCQRRVNVARKLRFDSADGGCFNEERMEGVVDQAPLVAEEGTG